MFKTILASTVLFFALTIAAIPCRADIAIKPGTYTDSYNITFGLIMMISSVELGGLDYPGEWVEYHIKPGAGGLYRPYINVRGAAGIGFTIVLTADCDLSSDEHTTVFRFVGEGFG